MFSSALFRKIFLLFLLVLIGYSLATYYLTVPLIKTTVYKSEEDSARTILNSVCDLIKTQSESLKAYRQSAIQGQQQELTSITLMAEGIIKDKYLKYEAGILTEDQARQEALGEISSIDPGQGRLVWVADYHGVMQAYTKTEPGSPARSNIFESQEQTAWTRPVDMALKEFQGFCTLRAPGQPGGKPLEYPTFVRNFPDWQWVVGTSTPMDDLEGAVERRRVEIVAKLRQMLRDIKIARTGYIYVFDSKLNMIIHPNPNIEGTRFTKLLDPVTNTPIGRELMDVADLPDQELHYKWDKPDDPGHYVYDKISWVRYIQDWDWYIASSVYVDELNSSAVILRNRIIWGLLAFIAVSLFLASLLVGRLLVPVRNLSAMAKRIKAGDLSARCAPGGRDELGLLAEIFNSMVDQLESYITDLDAKVRERTRELGEKNEQLQQEIAERSRAEAEIWQANETYRQIFENAVEGLFQSKPEGRFVKVNRALASILGYDSPEDLMESVTDISKQLYVDVAKRPELFELISSQGSVSNYEVELKRKDGRHIWVALSLRAVRDSEERLIRLEGLANDITARKLSELELQRKATMDELTGLPNRFLFQHTFDKMTAQARRSKAGVGVLYIDLDSFKKVNDDHGHQFGDQVLREAAQRIRSRLRDTDGAARWGGDEFTALLWNVSEEEAAAKIARDISKSLSAPYVIGEVRIEYLGAALEPASSPGMGRIWKPCCRRRTRPCTRSNSKSAIIRLLRVEQAHSLSLLRGASIAPPG